MKMESRRCFSLVAASSDLRELFAIFTIALSSSYVLLILSVLTDVVVHYMTHVCKSFGTCADHLILPMFLTASICRWACRSDMLCATGLSFFRCSNGKSY